tara:strand:- start:3616 stop:4044 length:429 start_codon:yes stop_codon:yes gene_type:complete
MKMNATQISNLDSFTIPRESEGGIDGGTLSYLFSKKYRSSGKFTIKEEEGKGSAFCIWLTPGGDIHYLGGNKEDPCIWQLIIGKHQRKNNQYYGGKKVAQELLKIFDERTSTVPSAIVQDVENRKQDNEELFKNNRELFERF